MLEARRLRFAYDGRSPILDNLSLRVAPGEIVGLHARSGYGKTTLCKILSGYEAPQGGEILVDGAVLSSYSGHLPVQLIWQHPELALNPRLRLRSSLTEAGALLEGVADGLHIDPAWLGRFPRELSGGELQRFCIARVLSPKTRYILADEISTMLDLVTQAQLWRFLVEQAARHQIGMLAVSHDPALLSTLCDRIIDLEEPS